MKPRILIMDDDTAICTMYTLMLERLGCECDTVSCGEKALEKYGSALTSQRPYRAVILDLTVGDGMGGLETIRALRQKFPDVLAVVASGSSHETMSSLCAGHGFNTSLPKPFRMQDIIDCLGRIGISPEP